MSKTIPFTALLPDPACAAALICPPYDVVEAVDARRMTKGNERSFLHVTRAEIDLPEGIDPHCEAVYGRAAANLRRFVDAGLLTAHPPSYYIYRLIGGDHVQTGIVVGASVDEYENGAIKQHERTREAKVVDRMMYSLATDAHAEPVFLVHRLSEEIELLKSEATGGKPLYDLVDHAGVRHILWKARDETRIAGALQKMPSLYIADGHHRSASAMRVRDVKRGENPNHRGDEAYNFFPAVIFPEDEVRIFQYDWDGDPAGRPTAKITMREIMDLSDRGGILPPKQTWFSPKLASGLFVFLL